MRGSNQQAIWSISGTGRKVAKISKHWKMLLEQGISENDSCDKQLEMWEKVVPLQFLHDMFSKKYAIFECPLCHIEI
jgi:hypothetical protein